MRNGERSIENDRTIFIIRSISCFNINSIYGVIFMSDYSWCQGPYCHEKRTQDRVRGVKGSKVIRTRRVRWYQSQVESKWNYFCGNTCLHDYINEHLRAFIAIAPRPEPLETPVEVKKIAHPAEEYNWGTRPAYTETVIESVDNVNR